MLRTVVIEFHVNSDKKKKTSVNSDMLLIFERKIFRRIYGPKYENGGMEKWAESRTGRGERRRKYSKMDKRAKDKMVRSTGENGGG